MKTTYDGSKRAGRAFLVALVFLVFAGFLPPGSAYPAETLRVLSPTVLPAQKISSFSADLIMLNPQGIVNRQVKIYVTPSKIRINNVYKAGGALIFRQDINVQWLLNPVNKTYLMKPLNETEFVAFNLGHILSSSYKNLGTEMVSGFNCSKKMVENTASFNGTTRKNLSTIWVSTRLGIPIRVKSQDGSITELRNVKAGFLQPALFDLPADYRKVLTMRQ